MPQQDNPSIGLLLQLGEEATAGDITALANRRLRNMRLSMRGEFVEAPEYRGEGNQWVSSVVPGDAQASGESEGPLSFTECCYPYESALKKVTPSGGAGGSQTRIYRPGVPGVDPFATYVFQKGNGRYNRQWNYGHWTGLTLNQTRNAATLNGPVMAQLNGTGIIDAMTATPTNVANVLVPPTKTGLFWARTMAELDSAPIRLTRNFEFALEVAGLRAPFNPMNELLSTFAGTVPQPEPDATLMMRLGVDVFTPTTVAARTSTTAYQLGDVIKKAAGPHTLLFMVITGGTSGASEPAAYGTAVEGQQITDGSMVVEAIPFDIGHPFRIGGIRNGETFYVMCRSIGPVIDAGSSTYYLHQTKVAVQFPQLPEDSEENGLATLTYNGRVVEDATAGYPFEIKVVNKLATL